MLTLGGNWILESFEPLASTPGCTSDPLCDPATISQYGYNQYGGLAEVNWKFLPKTAMILTGNYFTRQPTNTATSLAVSGWRALGGLAGLVTPRFAATAKVGYGSTSKGPKYSTWLADVEVEYVTPGPVGARLGYVHDYHADPGIDYAVYGFHRVYIQGKMLVAGRLTLRITGDWQRVEYVQNAATAQVAHLEPAADFEVMRWVVLTAGYAATYRTASVTTVPAFNYTQNELYLRAWGPSIGSPCPPESSPSRSSRSPAAAGAAPSRLVRSALPRPSSRGPRPSARATSSRRGCTGSRSCPAHTGSGPRATSCSPCAAG
jgi:hypothetical protein